MSYCKGFAVSRLFLASLPFRQAGCYLLLSPRVYN